MSQEISGNSMQPESMFRKKALDSLNSFEHLDHLMSLTSKRLWLVLTGCAIIIAVAITWGFYGKIPTHVRGTGIIVNLSGIKVVQASASGIISSINVEVNETVNQGQIVARIQQPDLVNEIKELRNGIRFAEFQIEQMEEILTSDSRMHLSYLDEQGTSLKKSLKRLEEMRSMLLKDVQVYNRLQKDGAISKMEQQQMLFNMMKMEMDVFQQEDKLASLPYQKFKVHSSKKKMLMEKRKQLKDKKVKLAELENKLKFDSIITSPFTGTVLEISYGTGQNVTKGSPIIVLNDHSIKDLQTVAFFPPMEGKRVDPQMTGFIAPSTVKPNRYGYIRGIISETYDYPATKESIFYILRNEILSERLGYDEAPIAAIVEMIPDQHTASGFEWTSSSGPECPIKSGTLCNIKVIVKEDAPIDLVIPYMKKKLFGEGENLLLKPKAANSL